MFSASKIAQKIVQGWNGEKKEEIDFRFSYAHFAGILRHPKPRTETRPKSTPSPSVSTIQYKIQRTGQRIEKKRNSKDDPLEPRFRTQSNQFTTALTNSLEQYAIHAYVVRVVL